MSKPQGPQDGPWRLSSTLSLLRVGDDWLVDDPSHGGYRGLNKMPEWLGKVLAGLSRTGPVDQQHLHIMMTKAGVPAQYIEQGISSLLRANMLCHPEENCPERDAGNLRDLQWARISPPINYRDPDAKESDIQTMYSYAKSEEPPACCTEVPPTWERVTLPRMTECASHSLGELSRFLYLANGVQAKIHYGPLPRTRRTSPSFGASHPFDLCLTSSAISGGRTTYYYHPGEHNLVALPASEADLTQEGTPCEEYVSSPLDINLSIHLAIERVQWRYRTSQVYPTVLLDFGHLIETLHMVAEILEVDLTEIGTRVEPPLAASDRVLGPQLRRYKARIKVGG